VNLDLSEESVEYGRVASRAIESAGGDVLVQTAEADPGHRDRLVAPVLEGLGAWDLEPREGPDQLEAAAALCRSAGHWGLDYPVAERLCRPNGLDVDGLVVVFGRRPVARVGSLDLTWAAVNLDGERGLARPKPLMGSARKTTFVAELAMEPGVVCDPLDLSLGLVLPCWTLLGMLDRALELTRIYVREREQFGQPLSAFQGVQFQLTDAEVERIGFEELAKYALWSVESNRDESIDDALALRIAAIEAADTVFRICHQLHGAIGFCDETTLSWLSRYSLPLRRLPLGLSGTREALTRRIWRTGLAGLFGGPA
jgi:hypothetical protein